MRVSIIRPSDVVIQAPAIIAPMLGDSIVAGRQRGEAFLNENGFDKQLYEVKIQHRALEELGSIGEIYTSFGNTFKGKLTGISINVSREEGSPLIAEAILSIEEPIIVPTSDDFIDLPPVAHTNTINTITLRVISACDGDAIPFAEITLRSITYSGTFAETKLNADENGETEIVLENGIYELDALDVYDNCKPETGYQFTVFTESRLFTISLETRREYGVQYFRDGNSTLDEETELYVPIPFGKAKFARVPSTHKIYPVKDPVFCDAYGYVEYPPLCLGKFFQKMCSKENYFSDFYYDYQPTVDGVVVYGDDTILYRNPIIATVNGRTPYSQICEQDYFYYEKGGADDFGLKGRIYIDELTPDQRMDSLTDSPAGVDAIKLSVNIAHGPTQTVRWRFPDRTYTGDGIDVVLSGGIAGKDEAVGFTYYPFDVDIGEMIDGAWVSAININSIVPFSGGGSGVYSFLLVQVPLGWTYKKL